MSLQGRTAVVTGSNSGIGLGIAEALAAAGADVVLNSYTDAEEDHALARDVAERHGVRARYVQADLADGAAARRLVEEAGTCDILVNNAGIQHVAPIPDLRARALGRGDRGQLVLGVPHHGRGAAADARGRLGACDQRGLGARAHGVAPTNRPTSRPSTGSSG